MLKFSESKVIPCLTFTPKYSASSFISFINLARDLMKCSFCFSRRSSFSNEFFSKIQEPIIKNFPFRTSSSSCHLSFDFHTPSAHWPRAVVPTFGSVQQSVAKKSEDFFKLSATVDLK